MPGGGRGGGNDIIRVSRQASFCLPPQVFVESLRCPGMLSDAVLYKLPPPHCLNGVVVAVVMGGWR